MSSSPKATVRAGGTPRSFASATSGPRDSAAFATTRNRISQQSNSSCTSTTSTGVVSLFLTSVAWTSTVRIVRSLRLYPRFSSLPASV